MKKLPNIAGRMKTAAGKMKTAVRLAGIMTGLLAATILLANPRTAQAQSDTLGARQPFYKGQSLWSQNGRYQFVLQADGNVVLYDHQGIQAIGRFPYLTLTRGTVPVWASSTNSSINVIGYLEVGTDWYLRLYGYRGLALLTSLPFAHTRPSLSVLWQSNSGGMNTPGYEWWRLPLGGNPRLVVGNDGNVRIYTLDNYVAWRARPY